ncbi:hypothetical protein [Paramicrobacterium fandaimingii]|uniref:hypothetical protein n=1 Tax=Paramicrobacterium fandaimingii TaxID=2708079 RepID=UPI00141DDB2D|nr:hypothetical protein [Microbacterium fandaimingii]
MSEIGLAIALSSIFILQDCARFRAFRLERSTVAFGSDALVLVVVVPGLIVLNTLGSVDSTALWIWGGGTLVGVIVPMIMLRYFPVPGHSGGRWLHDNRDLVVPSFSEYMLQSGFPYAVNWILLGIGGLEAVAGYRLIQILYAAVSNFALGLNSVLIPRIVNSKSLSLARKFERTELVTLGTVSTLALLVLVLVPESLATMIFGSTWAAMLPFLLPGALHGALNAFSVSNYSLLRLLGYAKYSLYVRVGSVVVSAVAVGIGMIWAGPAGVAWGMAVVALAAYLLRKNKVSQVIRNPHRIMRDPKAGHWTWDVK